jgi:hypothetical protein
MHKQVSIQILNIGLFEELKTLIDVFVQSSQGKGRGDLGRRIQLRSID